MKRIVGIMNLELNIGYDYPAFDRKRPGLFRYR